VRLSLSVFLAVESERVTAGGDPDVPNSDRVWRLRVRDLMASSHGFSLVNFWESSYTDVLLCEMYYTAMS